MTVLDQVLYDRPNFIEYDHKNRFMQTGFYILYIRSGRFSWNVLESVIQEFSLDGVYDSFMFNWICQVGKFGQEYCHLRYVGQCKKPINPLKRLNEDKTSRKNGFLANLFKKNRRPWRKFETQLKLYVLEKNATTWNNTFFNISNNDADIQEQVIIALFGLENILNNQSDGETAQ